MVPATHQTEGDTALYKSIEEVTARIAERYNGPTLTREGRGHQDFTYIPWHISKRLLDEVFGVFGWSTTAPHSYFDNGMYVVEFGLTVRVVDEQGNVIEVTRPAQGMAAGREGDDNAVKSAQSDALSRGSKLIGDAFGFYLYEKSASAPTQQPQRAQAVNATRPASNGRGPSPKQMEVFANNGYTAEQVEQLPDWRATLDGIFAQPKGTRRLVAVAQPAADDIPF